MDKVLALFVAALADPEEPFTSQMEETAILVAKCLGNMLHVVSNESDGMNKTDKSYFISMVCKK